MIKVNKQNIEIEGKENIICAELGMIFNSLYEQIGEKRTKQMIKIAIDTVCEENKKEYVKRANKVSISFSLPHKSGTLYNILAHFIFNGVNMTSIESIPLSGRQWEYCFFVDFEGNLSDNAVKNALKGIMAETEEFRILGCFVSENQPELED